MYNADHCGWSRCKEDSTIIYYSFVGLCDKHNEKWCNRTEPNDGPANCLKFLVNKHCSKIVKDSYKEIYSNG